MPLSGEAIRTMNYVDDISVTLRRILATIPVLDADEKARVATYLQAMDPSIQNVLAALK